MPDQDRTLGKQLKTGPFPLPVLAGWARLAEEIKGKEVSAEEKPLLARELDLWARRIAACESGDLRLARVYAIKKT
jgi:hypothetical protein